MTKTFEEELKDREAETFSHWDGCTISKKEFINYADVVNLSQGWVSPEEYEKLVKDCAVYVLECKNINRVNAQLTKENEDLKSQLQQQALPVVKDFVAEWYEGHKDNLDFEIYYFCCDLFKTKSEFATWFGNAENNSISTLIKMKDGYTVEKPKLFYLKHIDMSKRDSDSDWYLIKDDEGIDHEWEFRGEMPEEDRFKFTQQEIDSMQTGSYEQIEVAE